jgi:hypothetical protein
MCGAHDRNRTGEPLPYQGSALPTELHGLFQVRIRPKFRGRSGAKLPQKQWSGRRGSNSRHSAWKAEALPTELLPHIIIRILPFYRTRQSGASLKFTPCCSATIRHVVPNDPDTTAISYKRLAKQLGWWWGEDSNLRRRRRQIYSLFPLATREPHQILISWSQRRDSNPRPTDYKSVALPAELRWLKHPSITHNT